MKTAVEKKVFKKLTERMEQVKEGKVLTTEQLMNKLKTRRQK